MVYLHQQMSRICPGGLLSPSLYIITKNLFPPRWTKCLFLPLMACSLYLSEQKNKAEKTRKRKCVVICKHFVVVASVDQPSAGGSKTGL